MTRSSRYNTEVPPASGLPPTVDATALQERVCELGLQRSRDGVTTAERWALAQRLSGVIAASDPVGLDLFAGEA